MVSPFFNVGVMALNNVQPFLRRLAIAAEGAAQGNTTPILISACLRAAGADQRGNQRGH